MWFFFKEVYGGFLGKAHHKLADKCEDKADMHSKLSKGKFSINLHDNYY